MNLQWLPHYTGKGKRDISASDEAITEEILRKKKNKIGGKGDLGKRSDWGTREGEADNSRGGVRGKVELVLTS